MRKQFLTKAIALSLLLSSASVIANAQQCMQKLKIIGGSGDENSSKMISTGGESFIVSGNTNSANGNFNVPASHGIDAFLIKYNSINQIAWSKTFGGSGDDNFVNVIKTPDGGLLAIGATSSNDGNVSGNHGGAEDIWVVKLSANGNIQWQKCFGGSGDEFCYNVISTSSGYVIAGATNSTDGNVTFNHGDYDVWIIRISSTGNLISQKTYGGSAYDEAINIYRYNDGSYIFDGSTASNDGDVTNNHGGEYDTWLVKTNATGTLLWQKTYGGSGGEYPNEMLQTSDNNLVIAHGSNSTDGDVNCNGKFVAWLIKVNRLNGNIIWNKIFQNNTLDKVAFGMFPIHGGGFALVGTAGDLNDLSTFDAYVLKVNSNGNKIWEQSIAGSDYDDSGDGAELSNGIIVICGGTNSTDGEFSNSRGGSDAWIASFGNCCNHREIVDASSSISIAYFPNPISTSATISFNLSQQENVTAIIYDASGKGVATLCENKSFDEGKHQIEFNAEKIDAGIYFLKMQAGDVLKTEKLVVSK